MKIPDGLLFEKAATISVSAITCGQGFFQRMKLIFPGDRIKGKEYILIDGGSKSVSTLAIQYANL